MLFRSNAAPVLSSFSRDALRSVEHLIVNKLEAEDLLNKRQPASPTSWRRLEQGGDRDSEIVKGRELCTGLLDLGVKYAVVTMGGYGGVAGANKKGGEYLITEYKAVEAGRVADTTGCGGVFIGAYAVQYIRQKFSPGGFDLARAVNWAAKAAALSATSFGSLNGIPWEDQVEAP